MIARRAVLAVAAGLLAAPALGQDAPAPASLPRVALETGVGRVVIELAADKAPVTAANFLKYVDQKRLDGVTFYRTVKVADRYGFVQFGANGDPKRILPPIAHEPTTRTGLSHIEGTISVARFEPGSARGEFTISVGDNSRSLDANPAAPGDNQGYAAFGRVVEGMEVIVTILDAPVSPTKTLSGVFQGQVPEAAVKVVTARRVPPPAP